MTITHKPTTSLVSRISKIWKKPKMSLKNAFHKTTDDTVTLHSNFMNRNITVKKAGKILKNEKFYDDTHEHMIGQTDNRGVLSFYDSHKDCLVKAKFLDKAGSGKGEIGFKDYNTSYKKSGFSGNDYVVLGTHPEAELFLKTLLNKSHLKEGDILLDAEEDIFLDAVDDLNKLEIIEISDPANTQNNSSTKKIPYALQENYTLLFGKDALLYPENGDKNMREITAHLNKRSLKPKDLINLRKIVKISMIVGAIAGAVVISIPSMGVPIAIIAACWGGITLLSFALK